MDQAALEAWAAELARTLPNGAVVALHGDLGAGKTTAVRAMLRALGAEEAGTSPSYALVHRHDTADGPLFHLDAWRLRDPEEAADLDLDGLVAEGRAVFIEWPERLGAWLPPVTVHVQLAYADGGERRTAERR